MQNIYEQFLLSSELFIVLQNEMSSGDLFWETFDLLILPNLLCLWPSSGKQEEAATLTSSKWSSEQHESQKADWARPCDGSSLPPSAKKG